MKVISYNLRKNRAVAELGALAEMHGADVLCLQEAEAVALPARLGHMHLVHATERNRLGLAMYVRDERFHARTAHTFQLKKSLHDRLLAPAHERLLGVRMHDVETGRDLVVASFHAAPLTALNSLRRHQIHAALGELRALGPGLPALMVGDYNYPVFKNRLDTEMRDRGYELSLSDKRTYTRYRMFRGHFDFATSSGLDIGCVRTLDRGLSDHLPILVDAELSAHTAPVPSDVAQLAAA
ncbi:endonuclease/exonuclease/phosphatase family protein [Leucobacter allii]|uniref:Endonuclease/exonuclease/phosphatase family protein n=1 Tax=Leucobacter allii TaxID=2932247 RepID=A0ABY4FN63_9MICO|nr:endonuclease/exonuclease/phosphatase family protein [Leucobacter allii]UOQ57669.1 endonuclease/exonuclease/phosphatase family protein [Leucobacter allii]UOR02213.1 endonuclease/exonuclease/phosphatase family protein [Leucobacter allii]